MHSYLFPFFLLKLLNTVSYSDIFQVREKMVSAMSNVQVSDDSAADIIGFEQSTVHT
jgi:hypothetical protein